MHAYYVKKLSDMCNTKEARRRKEIAYYPKK